MGRGSSLVRPRDLPPPGSVSGTRNVRPGTALTIWSPGCYHRDGASLLRPGYTRAVLPWRGSGHDRGGVRSSRKDRWATEQKAGVEFVRVSVGTSGMSVYSSAVERSRPGRARLSESRPTDRN